MVKKIALFLLVAHLCYGQQLIYTVNLKSTETHKVQVTVELNKLGANTVTYQMPVWAPGAYSVTHYGRYATDFRAFDKHMHSLPVKQINDDRWEISDAKNIEKISYLIGDSHKDSTSLYFALAHIDSNFFFANGTCLFGYVNDKKNIPAIVYYEVPSSWICSTALDPANMYPEGGRNFKAKNYDELADAPVMAGVDFQTRTFTDGKARYDIVVASDGPFPMDSLEANIHKIVHAQTEFFHDTPFDHYTFLINAPTQSHMFSEGQGALEHANSSDYLLVNLPWGIFRQFGPAILSHEFFHLWNVKRIHSSLLGPFDYTKRVMTTSLWLSEGVTDYYAHTILTRSGIAPYRSFEEMVTELSRAMDNSKAARTKTLEELSIAESDFDLTNALVFYSKGTLVGLLLDIEIRSRTDNKKSLDDVMLALNADAKKGKTFKDKELIGKIEKITGLNLQDFYKKYIAGTDSLPIGSYLKKMGMGQHVTAQSEPSLNFGARMILSQNGEFVFDSVFTDGAMEKAGIISGDTIKLVNGLPLTIDRAIDMKEHLRPPATLDFDITRSTGSKHFTATLEKSKNTATIVKDIAPLPDATPMEIAIRHGIVGKEY